MGAAAADRSNGGGVEKSANQRLYGVLAFGFDRAPAGFLIA